MEEGFMSSAHCFLLQILNFTNRIQVTINSLLNSHYCCWIEYLHKSGPVKYPSYQQFINTWLYHN